MEDNKEDIIRRAGMYVEYELLKKIRIIYEDIETSLHSKRMERKMLTQQFINENVGLLGLSKEELIEVVKNEIKMANWIKEIEELHEDYYEENEEDYYKEINAEEREKIRSIEMYAEEQLIPQIRSIYEDGTTNLNSKREERKRYIQEFIQECINELGFTETEIMKAVDNVIKRSVWIKEIEEAHAECYDELPDEQEI